MSKYDFSVVAGGAFKVIQGDVVVNTLDGIDALDLTERIKGFVRTSKIRKGLVVCFNKHSTSSIITCNKREGIARDVANLFTKVISNETVLQSCPKRDLNAMRAYFSSSVIGTSIVLPVKESNLVLGEWQAVYLLEMNGSRERRISLLVLGTE